MISSWSCPGASPAAAEDVPDLAGELGIAALDRREIDRHPQPVRAALLPCRRLQAGLLQHPAADRQDQAAVLGEWDEAVGTDPAALRMAPAQQRLDPEHAPAPDVELRLVFELELAARERLGEILLQRLLLAQLAVHPLLEKAHRARRPGLRPAERQTGVLQQGLGVRAVARSERDPDPRADVGELPAELERLGERREQTIGEVGGVGRRGDPALQDRELVGPDPRQHVGPAQHRQQSRAAVAQQQIAGDAAQGLVDRLEVGEIDAQHRAAAVVAPRAAERRAQALAERRAVGEPGERVVP